MKADWLQITKPRLVLLVLWTVLTGFLLASAGAWNTPLLFKTLIGTASVAAGSMVLNQYLERDSDARMKRTANRPLASGRLKPGPALGYGIFLSLAGLAVLAAGVNFLSALLAALTLVSYLAIYTPLKKKTPLCTLAGAVPGALPPLIGWAAARGELGAGAWILFSILFVWQVPHFFALAWIFREDYRKAGFRMVSVVDPTGKRVGGEIMVYTLLLYLASFLPALSGRTGPGYYLGALLLGLWLLGSSFRTAFQLERRSRPFFRNSVFYLGLLLLLMLADWRPL